MSPWEYYRQLNDSGQLVKVYVVSQLHWAILECRKIALYHVLLYELQSKIDVGAIPEGSNT